MRSTTAYKRGVQDSLTKRVVLTDCRLVRGAGPPMMFIEHCLRHCVHLEVIEATGFGGINGAFHMNDLLMLLRTMNKMRPAPQVSSNLQRLDSTFLTLQTLERLLCFCIIFGFGQNLPAFKSFKSFKAMNTLRQQLLIALKILCLIGTHVPVHIVGMKLQAQGNSA